MRRFGDARPSLQVSGMRLLALFALLLGGCALSGRPVTSPATPTTVATGGEPVSAYDALFYRETGGWTGADAILSVALSAETTLWLYGDTSFDEIRDGKRRCPLCLANNSIAIQRGKNPVMATVEFFFGPPRAGKPTAFFTPPDGRGWLWPGHGIRTARGLALFLFQFERDPDPAFVWGKLVGSWLVEVANPDDPPGTWRIAYRQVPWTRITPQVGSLAFGQAVLREGEYLYIYGTDQERTTGGIVRHLVAARVPEGQLDDFAAWRFYADGQWGTDWRAVGRAFPAAPEFSVTSQPAAGDFVAVYTESGLSRRILLRRAPTPVGPWGAPQTIYECPEAARDPKNYCYAAKGHQDLSPVPGELLVTYAAQGSEDARLYFPHFVSVRFVAGR